ncbi:MAG: ParB/RepB/Spo0J family partition protein [Limnochordaceae bacterium]|nr:ParB/RepB/Spo0J family partition protein [Limnochordaceae bacterium]
MARQALGRGLQALMGSEAVSAGAQEIDIDRVTPSGYQARTEIDPEALNELAESIRLHGVVQPIVVRPRGDGYELVVGERRWRAAQLAGLRTIPAVVRELDERSTMELGLIENLQREDLNVLDEAEAYRRLMEEFGLTQEQVASAVGKKRSSVANALRLLSLSARVKELVRSGKLGAGHAKVLAGLESEREQLVLAQAVVERGWSVRQLEDTVRRRKSVRGTHTGGRAEEGASNEESSALPADIKEVVEALQRFLGTKVRCRPGKQKSVLEIEYYGEEDLRRILERVAAQLGGRGGVDDVPF